MRQLLIGCGVDRTRHICPSGTPAEWGDLVTLDYDPNVKPDVLHNLEARFLPFEADEFDEIHAYDVLEHVGQQGDWRFFFRQWEDFWTVLKPDGLFCGICPDPAGVWAWGDPGHTRIIAPECLSFLDRTKYGTPPMTDYRPWYRGDYSIEWLSEPGSLPDRHAFVLRAVKPAREP